MKSRSPARWIPCVLCALAVHLILVTAWSGRADVTRIHTVPDEPEFRLVLTPYLGVISEVVSEDPPVLTEVERDACGKTQDEIAQAGSDHPWVGVYTKGVKWHGLFHRLCLGTSTYYLETEFGLREYGAVRVQGNLLLLGFQGGSSDNGLPQELVWISRPPLAWVGPMSAVPGLFYTPEKGCSATFGVGYWREAPRWIEASAQPRVPACYSRAWESSAHFKLLEQIPPNKDCAFWLGRFELRASGAVERGETLYSDGELRSCVRAIVRDVRPTQFFALIDVPDGASPEGIPLGTTFTRLPRLE